MYTLIIIKYKQTTEVKLMTIFEGFHNSWVLANGVRTHYSWAGTEGPAVILLHGAGPGACGAAGWRLMLPALAEAGYRAFAPDQLSMGFTDTRPHAWPVNGHQSLVDHVHDFIEALCLDEVYLVGNSQGAYIAAKYAIDHPEKVKKVFYIGSNTIYQAMQEVPARKLRSFLEVIGYDYTEESLRKFMTRNSNGAEVPEELIQLRHQAANRPGVREANKAFDDYLEKMNNDAKLWDRYCIKDSLPKLKIPGKFIWGKNDGVAPIETAYKLEKLLPNIEFEYIDNCGHQCQTDQPELVNKLVIDFFGLKIEEAATVK
ncbi:alpha/beta hydrolase [Niallia endozanthoxylica]|uniref:Alpha/beta hydrolase n=2 Tax=Niallia endozanthoxylica TaxID=2036016 RepID=A0A5J5I5B5_9BACI|nr:alpha/beta hydrolase [Niallia endozanthoxylica]